MSRCRPLVRGRAFGALLAVALISALSGCSYIFSEKRTVYQYEPSYGVDSPEFRRSLDALGTEMVPDNAAVLLLNGDETFETLLAAIRAARESVNIELYIFSHDATARTFAQTLSERARAGV
ncbi:MAG TPA: hypothetical protein VLO07_08770, partial [Thermoanaerobaculia bacterium]|nr:hypothetical protein [Thermoanaerobaculia bacterium]